MPGRQHDRTARLCLRPGPSRPDAQDLSRARQPAATSPWCSACSIAGQRPDLRAGRSAASCWRDLLGGLIHGYAGAANVTESGFLIPMGNRGARGRSDTPTWHARTTRCPHRHRHRRLKSAAASESSRHLLLGQDIALGVVFGAGVGVIVGLFGKAAIARRRRGQTAPSRPVPSDHQDRGRGWRRAASSGRVGARPRQPG